MTQQQSIAPLFLSPCDLAQRMPAMAADFLELETRVGRRFREDSVTDIIIASLLKIGAGNATVFTPPEPKTGGDFDIVIFQPTTGNGIQYRIQSKRLIQNHRNWAWSSYKELDHPHGTGKQASTLIRSSAQEKIPTIPLYAFYNPSAVCAASNGQINGIQLADGRAINAIVRALVKYKKAGKRPRWKRLEHLQHLFFPLTAILCPPGNEDAGGFQIIEPELSRQSVLSAINQRRSALIDFDFTYTREERGATEASMLPFSEQLTENITEAGIQSQNGEKSDFPDIVQRAIRREPHESSIQRARLRRPKLVLLSR